MKNTKLNITGIIILFISIVCVFFGISYAIFSYFGDGMTTNVIQTGRVVFSYSDANDGGNGIRIENALPILDEMGKLLSGEGEFFDFNVSATTTSSNLAYEIVVNKDKNSTLEDEFIKVYLTEISGEEENPIPLVLENNRIVTYDELDDTTNKLLEGKTVYFGTVKSGEIAYGKRFRLRMWLKNIEEDDFDYTRINNKFFTLKVNVAATSVY